MLPVFIDDYPYFRMEDILSSVLDLIDATVLEKSVMNDEGVSASDISRTLGSIEILKFLAEEYLDHAPPERAELWGAMIDKMNSILMEDTNA